MRAGQRASKVSESPGVNWVSPVFYKIAEALGGHGELVEDPADLTGALERAFDAGVPAIVNVRTDPTSRALSNFVGSKME
ncbi:MAG: hypothetical protein CM1200mP39_12600 [Dehalococcoidia bacterium]|nr:MAG: hypothetical protein CM1200mP39_12600 [Dehalococcoidia bacterium]